MSCAPVVSSRGLEGDIPIMADLSEQSLTSSTVIGREVNINVMIFS